MSIRFRCNHCNRLLCVGGRKKGATVGCPRCGRPNIVPATSTAPLRRAKALAAADSSDSGIANVVYEDVDTLISGGELRANPERSGWRANDANPKRSARREGHSTVDREPGMAGWLVVQAIALLVVLTIGLLIGYLIGRGGAVVATAKAVATPKVDPGVVLWGRLFYKDNVQRTQPDNKSLVLALPDTYRGAPELNADVLWVVDAGGDTLVSIGGIAGLTDDEGTYSLRLPKPGKYHLFIISGHATRSEGELLSREASKALARYVPDPMHLLKDRRFVYCFGEFSGAQPRIEHDFGA